MKLICTLNELIGTLYGISLIYVSSKHVILMIGGMIYDNNDLFPPLQTAVGIWKFCLKTQKWIKLFNFNYLHASVTLSSNENYVLITGEQMILKNCNKLGENNKIFVLRFNK